MKDLADRMRDADWWYDFSDDGDVRRRGAAEIRHIREDLRVLHEQDPERARQLWTDHAPKEWFPPRFLEPVVVEAPSEPAAVPFGIDTDFIQKARAALNNGLKLFYTSRR